jgi:hypothetical protein
MNIFFTKEKQYYAFTHQESDRILLALVKHMVFQTIQVN